MIWPVFENPNHNVLYGAFLIFLIVLSFVRPKVGLKYQKIELMARSLIIILFIIALRVWGNDINI
jgi:uncharacterized membrane protein